MPNILVVDDDRQIVDLVTEYLAGEGYTVIGVTEVHVALNKASKFKPDLVILDYHMPGGGGLELLKNLRQLTLTEDVPVLFLSATPKYEILYNVIDTPLVAFLEKPIDFDKLNNAILELLNESGAGPDANLPLIID
ncbi:MAG: hypothetical protein A3J74_06210 [Elusimicrobia bacterium RIFCSPHIGHO2_02_FULL_57_9]|nr:MAG: hypothetical protein A3J74_06210 [Elusimicrobia bacterium RIFCSPHIGHO2_02_FULL_57_9]